MQSGNGLFGLVSNPYLVCPTGISGSGPVQGLPHMLTFVWVFAFNEVVTDFYEDVSP